MISSLSDTNRYVLPVNPGSNQGTSFDARAPDGYQGSTDGLAAGERVQSGLEGQRGTPGGRERPTRPSVRPSLPTDSVTLEGARDAGESEPGAQLQPEGPNTESALPESDSARSSASASEPPSANGDLEPADRQELQQLQQRDAEVRTHEQAHAAAGGSYAGQPQYEYERGPDGRQYAVGGEVSIDASPVPGDPEATIDKMRVVRRAALAPAEPSPQDRRVAAEATRTETEARRALNDQQREERDAKTEEARENGVFAGPVNPFTDDGKTAADVGQAGGDSGASPGGLAANAVKRARSELAFAGPSANERKS